jgi:hypothetical protein
MARSGKTRDRPEQDRLREILFFLFIARNKSFMLDTEYTPRDLKDYNGISVYWKKPPRIDVVVVEGPLKLAFRLMGPPHEERLRRIRDENQKELLEGNGWKVIDFWYDRHAALWRDDPESRQDAEKLVRETLDTI